MISILFVSPKNHEYHLCITWGALLRPYSIFRNVLQVSRSRNLPTRMGLVLIWKVPIHRRGLAGHCLVCTPRTACHYQHHQFKTNCTHYPATCVISPFKAPQLKGSVCVYHTGVTTGCKNFTIFFGRINLNLI